MFLGYLKTEVEKKAFLELALAVARADKKIAMEESKILEAYASEMELTLDMNIESASLDVSISELNSKAARMATYIELLALANADSDCCSEEMAIIQKVSDEFGISRELAEKCQVWVERITSLYSEGYELING